jgi:antitoxin component YwqK of YwqJK toxin-antitoxin module
MTAISHNVKKTAHALTIVSLLTTMLFVFSSCVKQDPNAPPGLTSINIIDRNGLSETISNTDRLDQYAHVDFLTQQPYQKVLRIYGRDVNGDMSAIITSYHPNGHPKQYLEVVNNRAHGAYKEWYVNGRLKLETYVIGGEADINTAAEESWLFEGCSSVWDEEGHLIAEIPYIGGQLQGISTYYHPNGVVWKKITNQNNLFEGPSEIYLDNGDLFQTTWYVKGAKQGSSIRYWNDGSIAADECYCDGLLTSGSYFNRCGDLVSQVIDGDGNRALFGKETLCELQEYHNGVQEGKVQVFAPNGALTRLLHMKNDVKNGEEIEYYPLNEVKNGVVPKLSINWIDGVIQGSVKTWYPTGTKESQREIANNCKNGLLTAWYTDGGIMLIEEYDRDKLVKGEYFAIGERIPASEIHGGRGLATLYDARGNFLRKVIYNNGKPLID